MKRVRIGVISFEHMHAFSYTTQLCGHHQVELVGIADDDQYRGSAMASHFGCQYYQSSEALLDQGLDGVVVCTNNWDHAEATVAALKRKIHVLVEKPFAVTIEQADQMIAAAEKAGVRVLNAFPMRFNPNVIAAKRAVDAGKIGEILCITGINHGKIPDGWFIDPKLSGGGAVMDHTVHLVDLYRWFTNSEVKTVYCESGDLLHNKNIDDTGLVMVQMDNGVFASIDCSWAHHTNYPIWAQLDMEIVGTKGTIDLKAFAQVVHLDDQTNQRFEDIGWNESGDEGLIDEFVEVCLTDRAPLVDGMDGKRALEAALAAYQSSVKGAVVTLN